MEEISLDQQICNNWFKAFHSSIIQNSEPDGYSSGETDQHAILKKQIYRNCARSHFETINLPEIIGRYKKNLGAFIQFLEKEWGWIVTVCNEENTLIADENKKECVCPPFGKGIIRDQSLCNCSQEFAKPMFEFILDKEVKSEVLESVIRGDNSCKYKISF